MRIGLVTVILSFLFIKCLFAQPVPDIEMVKAKLHELSLIHSMGDQTKADQSVRSMMDNLNSEGKWPDINYNDRTHSKWLPSQHWFRLVDLSYQYNNKASEYFGNPVLLNVIKKGISWWLGAKPRADNFWWNAIGIPQQMGKVFMLMEKRLEDSIMVPGIKMMSMAVEPTHYEYHGPATGQNLLWLTAIHLHAACLQKDEAGINRAFSEIGKEIVVTDKEGIQEDFSFHQHGPMTYVFGYGKGFAESASQLMFLAHGTKWQFPREKVEILSRYILGGMQWMTRNDYLEYSAMGREISRQESNRKGEVVSALKYIMELDPSRKGQYEVFYHQLTEKKREKPLVGNRYFWRSDLMVHQRENYYFSIKATSDRIFSGESGNGENLKGFYHGHGTHYLIVQGNEYHDIFPVWDWRKLPGLLCSQRPRPLPLFDWGKGSKGATTFAYGLSDSLYGCFGYDYKKDNVSAKKSWFLFDSEIIHLVSDASGDSLYQSINQELSDGEAWIEKGKNGYDRIYHGSTGYLIGGKVKTVMTNDIQTGSWMMLW